MKDQTKIGSVLEELVEDPAAMELLIQEIVTKRAGLQLVLQVLAADPERLGHFLLQWVGGFEGEEGKRTHPAHEPKAEGQKQVKFECTEAFYKWLNDEKLQRSLTLQQLVIRALERYFALPESFHRRIEEQAQILGTPLAEYIRQQSNTHHVADVMPTKEPLSPRERKNLAKLTERASALAAIFHYLQQFPDEKVNIVRESLALDLKYYRTSRTKPVKGYRFYM